MPRPPASLRRCRVVPRGLLDVVRGEGRSRLRRTQERGTVGANGVKQRRAAARRLRYPETSSKPIETSELTLLERRSVGETTERDYRLRYDQFLMWCRQTRLLHEKMNSEKELLDNAALLWMHERFFEGADGTEGSKLLAVIAYFRFDLVARPGPFLPRSRRASKGWLKLAPPRARLPTPWPVAGLIADYLAAKGLWWHALYVVVSFVFYLRPSEALGLRCHQVIAPVARGGRAYRHWSLVLFPGELETRSKTGASDESMLNDVEEFKFLDKLLEIAKRVRGPEELLFPFTYGEMAAEFKDAGTVFNLNEAGVMHLYQLRHGGASHDALCHHRDLLSIKKRGRWMCDASVRRYEKGGRSAQILHRLPAPLLQRAVERTKQLGETLAGRSGSSAQRAKHPRSPSRSSVALEGGLRAGGLVRPLRTSPCWSGTLAGARSSTSP